MRWAWISLLCFLLCETSFAGIAGRTNINPLLNSSLKGDAVSFLETGVQDIKKTSSRKIIAFQMLLLTVEVILGLYSIRDTTIVPLRIIIFFAFTATAIFSAYKVYTFMRVRLRNKYVHSSLSTKLIMGVTVTLVGFSCLTYVEDRIWQSQEKAALSVRYDSIQRNITQIEADLAALSSASSQNQREIATLNAQKAEAQKNLSEVAAEKKGLEATFPFKLRFPIVSVLGIVFFGIMLSIEGSKPGTISSLTDSDYVDFEICEDDPQFRDDNNDPCSAWESRNCYSYPYSPDQLDFVRETCPCACLGKCGDLDPVTKVLHSESDLVVDCSEWKKAQRNAPDRCSTSPDARYSAEDLRKIRDACPKSCNVPRFICGKVDGRTSLTRGDSDFAPPVCSNPKPTWYLSEGGAEASARTSQFKAWMEHPVTQPECRNFADELKKSSIDIPSICPCVDSTFPDIRCLIDENAKYTFSAVKELCGSYSECGDEEDVKACNQRKCSAGDRATIEELMNSAIGETLGCPSVFEKLKSGSHIDPETGCKCFSAMAKLVEDQSCFLTSSQKAPIGAWTHMCEPPGDMSQRISKVAEVSYPLLGNIMIIWISALSYYLFGSEFGKEISNPDIITFGDALYQAAVTHTTTGYGDKYPRTRAAKLILMVHALMVFFVFGATLYSIALTYSDPESLELIAGEVNKLVQHDVENSQEVI